MLRNAPDNDLRELLRQLAKAADINLTEDRINEALQQFRVQLGWIETLAAFHVPRESEPGPVTRLKPWQKEAKK